MSKLNLPLVKGEDDLSRTFRMVFTVGIIIVGLFVLVNYYAAYHSNCDFIPRVETFADAINTPVDLLPLKYHNNLVMAKSVVLYNLNQKVIPVEQIILIDENRKTYYITRHNAIISHMNKEGSSITFTLPAIMPLAELIIDVGEGYNAQNNIITSQIEVRDANDIVIWHNIKPLSGNVRYNYLNVKKKEILAKPRNNTNKDNGEYNEIQEHDLDNTLQLNTYKS